MPFTDNNIKGRDELGAQIEAEVNATLSRFSDKPLRPFHNRKRSH